MNPVLFLDFDGALSKGLTKDFRHRGLFESWLRLRPSVWVVVTSTWRLHHTLEELRDLFSADIRPRIVGTTPVLEGEPLKRQAEILAWRKEHRHTGLFVALDDQSDDFEVVWPHLVTCTRHGITEAHLAEIDQHLQLA